MQSYLLLIYKVNILNSYLFNWAVIYLYTFFIYRYTVFVQRFPVAVKSKFIDQLQQFEEEGKNLQLLTKVIIIAIYFSLLKKIRSLFTFENVGLCICFILIIVI